MPFSILRIASDEIQSMLQYWQRTSCHIVDYAVPFVALRKQSRFKFQRRRSSIWCTQRCYSKKIDCGFFFFCRIACHQKRCVRTTTTGANVDHNLVDGKIDEYLSSHNLLDGLQNVSQQKLYAKIIQSLETVYGKDKVTVAHLQSFGEVGLKALVASIQREEGSNLSLSETTGTNENEKIPFVTVRFKVPHHHTEFDTPWYYDTSFDQQKSTLLDLGNPSHIGAELLSEYIEASCGGNGSCSTCHVYVDIPANDDSSKAVVLSDVSEAELDMLELAFEPTEKSRLACQVRLIKIPPSMTCRKSPTLTVTIPSGVNNAWN
jgi:ferredoxin